MEKQIQQTVRLLKRQYTLFWAIPVLIIVAGECELFPVGLLADEQRVTYLFETIAILITAACVPLALKLFSWVLTKKIDQMTFPVALKQYIRWSSVRLSLLEASILFNLAAYYTTMHSTGALCALIGLTASLFCIPNESRLRNELHITINED